MVICKFFLQGNCRFGDYCKFEHQFGDAFTNVQQKNSASILRQPNFAGAQPAKPPNPVNSNALDANTLVKSVVNDMSVTEKGGQWLLSCYGPCRDQPSLPGLEDQSFEEVRFGYYEARKNGTVEQYKQQVQMMLQQAMLKLKSLQSPSLDIINLLKSLYATPQQSQSGIFGGNTFAANSTFNNVTIPSAQQQQTFNQQPSSSIFAQANQTLFANKPPEPNVFGGTQKTSIFGGPANVSPFGQGSSPPYPGQANSLPFAVQANSPPFAGQVNSPPYAGQVNSQPFAGQASSQPFAGQANSPPFAGQANNPPFAGQANNPPFGGQVNSPPFGGQVTSPPFGGQANSSPFGGQANSPAFGGALPQMQTPNKSVFAQASVNPTSGASIFGASTGSAIAGSNIFSNAQASNPIFNAQQTTSPFGNTPLQNKLPVAQPQVSSNMFVKQQQPANIFGGQNTASPFNQPAAANIFGAPPNQNVSQTLTDTTKPPLFPQQSVFAQQTQQPASNSPFGPQAKPNLEAQQSNIFGSRQPQATSIFGGNQQQQIDETIYSKPEDLTEEEIKWFESDELDIMNIPEKPPTIQMCFKT